METFVTVCTGHRCSALMCAQQPNGLGRLRAGVASSSEAVLVSMGCVGACAQAPVVALSTGQRCGQRLDLTCTTWLGPLGPEAVEALADHVCRPNGPLPRALVAAAFRPVAARP